MALWSVGETLTAAKLNLTVPGYEYRKVKTADETVTSSAVLQDDDHLFFPVPAGASYWSVECLLAIAESTGTPDVKLAFTWPSGYSMSWAPVFDDAATLGTHWLGRVTGAVNILPLISASGAAISFGTGTGTPGMGIYVAGMAFDTAGAGSAGNVQLQWAQNGANASGVTIKRGSTLVAKRFNQ